MCTALLAVMLTLLLIPGCNAVPVQEQPEHSREKNGIELPAAPPEGQKTLEELLQRRFSVREFSPEALDLETVSALLWAGGGQDLDVQTGATRTVPSAGATYAVELALGAGQVEGLKPGIYEYSSECHRLRQTHSGDPREALAEAAGQEFVAQAPAVFIVSGVYERTTATYGERGERYVHMEAGHVAQNLTLQAQSRQLGSVLVGAFQDGEVQEFLSSGRQPLLLIPVGKEP